MADPSVAIVTGGAQGLGAAICVVLLKRGCKVCVADIQEMKGKDFVKEMQSEYGKESVMFSLCDVSKKSDFEATFIQTINTFKKVDILMNNAGIANLDHDPETIISVNLMSVIYGCEMAFRFMGKTKGGNGGIVINTASAAGLKPCYYVPLYCAAKHGVIGLTRSYGDSYYLDKEGIVFAAICPFGIDSEYIRNSRKSTLKRFTDIVFTDKLMSPDFVANSVVKILEEKINGSILLVSNEVCQYIGLQEELKQLC